MVSYVVTGASRGIGLEFVQQLSKNTDNVVFGLVRNPATASELVALQKSRNNVHILHADVTDRTSLKAAAKEAAAITGGTLDYLINNAAFIQTERSDYTLDSYPENEADLVNQDIMEAININVLGAVHSINAFLPLLKATAATHPAKVITLSSGVGDLDATLAFQLGSLAPYSISKAAVNMVVAKYAATFTHQKQNLVFLAISPGLVDTSVQPPTPAQLEQFQDNVRHFQLAYPNWDGKPITPETSVKLMLEVIHRWEVKDSGAFVSHFGNKEWL